MQNTFPYQISHSANANLSTSSDNRVPVYGANKAYSSPPSSLSQSSQLQSSGAYLYQAGGGGGPARIALAPQPLPPPQSQTQHPPPPPQHVTAMDLSGFAGLNNPYLNINIGSKLFVGQVPGVCTEEQLRPIFAEFGTLLEVKIMREQSGRSKGSAWVRYESEESARRAIETLNEKWVIPPQTNPLRVQFASPSRRTTATNPHSNPSSSSNAASTMANSGGSGGGNPTGLGDFPVMTAGMAPPPQAQLAAAFSTNAGGSQVYPQQQLYSNLYTLNRLPSGPAPAPGATGAASAPGLRGALTAPQPPQPYLYTNVGPATATASYAYMMPSQNAQRQGY